MGADLQYTLGLDGGSFSSAAAKAISIMGQLQLAVDLVERAAGAMASAFAKASDVEKTTTAINTITKSAETTAAVMRDLTKLAAETPFEMSDLAPAARALLGAGTAAKDVAKQLRMLGDIASGADTDIGGLVSVFNQVRGKGKLLTDDFIQLAERGVAGLREQIASLKGVSVAQVADQLSAGAVSAADLEAVFRRMTTTGGLFFNAMVNQSQTFAGKLSSLSDGWTALQVKFAAPINQALKPVLDDLIKLGATLEPVFAAVGHSVAAVVTDFRGFIEQIQAGRMGVDALWASFGGLIERAVDFATIPINALIAALPGLGSAFLVAIGPLAEYLAIKLEMGANKFASILLGAVARATTETAKALPLNEGPTATLSRVLLGSQKSAWEAIDNSRAGKSNDGWMAAGIVDALKGGQKQADLDYKAGESRLKALNLSVDLNPAKEGLVEAVQAAASSLTSSYAEVSKRYGFGQEDEPAPESWSMQLARRNREVQLQGRSVLSLPAAVPAPGAGEGGRQNDASVGKLDAILQELQRLNAY